MQITDFRLDNLEKMEIYGILKKIFRVFEIGRNAVNGKKQQFCNILFPQLLP